MAVIDKKIGVSSADVVRRYTQYASHQGRSPTSHINNRHDVDNGVWLKQGITGFIEWLFLSYNIELGTGIWRSSY